MKRSSYDENQRPGACRKPWFLRLVRRYARRRVSGAFDGVYVSGLAAARALSARRPVIVTPNHVAWWDAFVAVLIDQALGSESYCLMDTGNLQRLPFFNWIGAIPLDRSDHRASMRDLRKSLTLLDRPGRALWIFAQGQQRPPHLRPLALRSGVAWLAAQSRAPVLPLSISYLYADAPSPRILLHFGPPLDPPYNRQQWMKALQARLIEGLEANDRCLIQGDGDYEPLVAPGKPSTDTPAAARILALFSGRGRIALGNGSTSYLTETAP